ncbi:MAG: restriction endonuclease subunit S [Ignavibacteriae bacterium HGW-Ignavibacteriae-4]|jgi:type I restriction enzyme S subunit|nr:MAG: restriction endonuclease subunit S [Ignavibacteriae bacterium HGW-Ignavibacteriae-4]
MTKEKNIPELRFPEFEGEWKNGRLGEIATFSRGKSISKSDIVENGTLDCIRYGELYTVYSEIIDETVSKTNIDPKELVLSEENDVIIPASGETQIDIATASCVLRDGIALSGDLNIIRSSLNGIFLSYYLNNARKLEIARLSQGISVVHLYSSQLKTLKINQPEPQEQQKIASFLTAVDQRIQLLQKKKGALEEYKKGVMQKIFSREIRFKPENGNDFPDWEEKRLGEVCNISKGQQLNKTELTESGKYPCQNGGIEPSGFTNNFNTIENTITISEGGNSCGYVNFLKSKFWCGGHCYALLEIKAFTEKKFLFHFLKFNQNELMRLRVGSGLPNIQKRDILNLIVSLPSFVEQQKIGSFLSAIEKAIESLETELDISKEFKKGLLQKMFV